MKRKSFFRKLSVAYLFIVVLYTVMAVGLFFYRVNEMNKEDLHRKNQGFLQQMKSQVDMKFEIAFDWMHQIKTDQNIKEYVSNQEKNYYNISNVYKKMQDNLLAFSHVGYTVGISKPDDDLIITTNGTRTKQRFFQEMGFDQEQFQEIIKDLNQTEILNEYMIDSSQGKLIYRGEDIINYDKRLQYFIIFSEKKLFSFMNSIQEGAFLVLRNDELITIQNNNLPEEIIGEISSDQVNEKKIDKNRVNSIEYKDYYAYNISSGLLDWEYIYVTPKDMFKPIISKLIKESILIYLVMLIVGTIISILLAKKVYKPIGNAVKVLTDLEDYSIDEKDELNYITNTAYFIQKANEQLEKTIQNNKLILKNKFLYDLLHGIVSREDTANKIKHYDLDILQSDFVLGIIEYTNFRHMEQIFSKEIILGIKSQILDVLKEGISQEFNNEVIDLGSNGYVIIIKSNELTQIKRTLKKILSDIQVKFELNMVAAISNPIKSVYSIEQAFDEVNKNLEYQFVFQKQMVISTDDVKSIVNENYFYPLEEERSLINYTIYGNRKEAMGILQRILEENFENRKLSKEIVSQFLFVVVATINRIMQQMNRQIDELFEDGSMTYVYLRFYENHNELKEKIVDLFETIMNKTLEEKNKMEGSIAGKMLEFIHINYNKDISLEDIAEAFNLTTNYMGVLFKESTAHNFKDYLNMYRVEKAKELLKSKKGIKIKEVAELVGCNNVNTFIRIFKKYEGISPGKYSKQV